MHAAPCASVSELYSADEVALLLDEIRDLEPTSCRGEDVQDFEIAGSGLAGAGEAGSAGSAGSGGGRSPCGTELTERSWDSHAQYSRAAPAEARRVAPLYCRLRHVRSAAGAATLLLALLGAAACACVWALAGLRAGRLPLAGRVRLLLLAALWSALAHGALLAAHVSRLHALLPVDWRALRLASAALSALALGAGAAATAHAVLLHPAYTYAPPHVVSLLLAAATCGCAGALVALAMVAAGARGCWARHSHRLRPPAPPAPPAAAYRAVPCQPPPPPQPSTSRDHAL